MEETCVERGGGGGERSREHNSVWLTNSDF